MAEEEEVAVLPTQQPSDLPEVEVASAGVEEEWAEFLPQQPGPPLPAWVTWA